MPVTYGTPQARHDLELVALRPTLTPQMWYHLLRQCSLHPCYTTSSRTQSPRGDLFQLTGGKAHMHDVPLFYPRLVAGQLHNCHAVLQSMQLHILLSRAVLHTNIVLGTRQSHPRVCIQDPPG